MIYAGVHVEAGHNATFFYCVCDFIARLGQGLVGSCLCQMVISYSVIEIFSLCDERRALL